MKSLFAKMVNIRKAIGTFAKDKRNDYHKYNYASAAQVFEVIGSEMANQGLVCLPRIVEIQVSPDGGRYQVQYEFTLADAESGETYTMSWFNESLVGKDDKSINKATTTALKYFLMTLFVVSSDDAVDTDADRNADHTPQPISGTTKKGGKTSALKADSPIDPKKLGELWGRGWVPAHFRDKADFFDTIKLLAESGTLNDEMDVSAIGATVYDYAVLSKIAEKDVKKAREDWKFYVTQQVKAGKIDAAMDAKTLMTHLNNDIDFWMP